VDDIAAYVEAAERLGMAGVQFQSPGQLVVRFKPGPADLKSLRVSFSAQARIRCVTFPGLVRHAQPLDLVASLTRPYLHSLTNVVSRSGEMLRLARGMHSSATRRNLDEFRP